MSSISWYTLLFAAIIFIGGSAIGVSIYAAISAYLNLKPKIGCRVDTDPLFEDLSGVADLRSQIEISDGHKTYSYSNLQIAQVQVKNQSKQDFDQFELGITLSSKDVVIHLEVQSPGRHHLVKQIDPFTFTEPKPKADLILQPFNRDDAYTLRLLSITAEPNQRLGEINFSSPVAVRFVDLPRIQETIKDTAKSATISLGPFSFSFD
ncbi:MAG: hypothetical protein KME43_19360 [Myxacorys chilensis ATA2-1-KO14]|jgi:hypothetical protein|nr:hypothetical protein [Myxacorys chilensis ATA2-1-KO14]